MAQPDSCEALEGDQLRRWAVTLKEAVFSTLDLYSVQSDSDLHEWYSGLAAPAAFVFDVEVDLGERGLSRFEVFSTSLRGARKATEEFADGEGGVLKSIEEGDPRRRPDGLALQVNSFLRKLPWVHLIEASKSYSDSFTRDGVCKFSGSASLDPFSAAAKWVFEIVGTFEDNLLCSAHQGGARIGVDMSTPSLESPFAKRFLIVEPLLGEYSLAAVKQTRLDKPLIHSPAEIESFGHLLFRFAEYVIGQDRSPHTQEPTAVPEDRAAAEWSVPEGYVRVSEISNDSAFKKNGKSPPRTTVQRWADKPSAPEAVKDPATGENCYPREWVMEQRAQWAPRA